MKQAVKERIIVGLVVGTITLGLGAGVGYFLLPWQTRIVEAAKEELRRERLKAANVEVRHDPVDQWHRGENCFRCHGQHPGGTIVSWDNVYKFRFHADSPIRIKKASVHAYRVRFSLRHWALVPSIPARQIKPIGFRKPGEPRINVCEAYPGPYRPSFVAHTVRIPDLTDGPQPVVADLELGEDASRKEITIQFVLDEQYEKQVRRIGYWLVEIMAVVVFRTDDNQTIATDPLLICIPVRNVRSPDRAPQSSEFPRPRPPGD